MYKILIVDDIVTKIDPILEEFREDIEEKRVLIDYELEVKKALSCLEKTHYDMLILDVQLPTLGSKKNISESGGIDILHLIETMNRLKKPSMIIGLTSHGEKYEENFKKFQDSLWLLVKFDRTNREWLEQIRKKVNYCIQSKETLLNDYKSEKQYDCAVIVAVKTEFEALINSELDWKRVERENISFYESCTNKGKRIVVAQQNQMGMVAATFLSEKLIEIYRPKIICMVGIAAGREGEVELGDIIVANESWDYGSGKIKFKEDKSGYLLEPDPHQIPISASIKNYLSGDFLDVLYNIRKKWNSSNGNKQTKDINLHIGSLASGSSVVQSNEMLVEYIQPHNRKLLGIDMETYAVYYTAFNSSYRPEFISIKSVCDFANIQKNDNYQEYAAFTSFQFLLSILDDIVSNI